MPHCGMRQFPPVQRKMFRSIIMDLQTFELRDQVKGAVPCVSTIFLYQSLSFKSNRSYIMAVE